MTVLFSILMNLLDKRAIKIVQLQEELEEAKRIITEFVWPGDGTKESNQRFQQKAARFAGCTVPIFDGQPERPNSLENNSDGKHFCRFASTFIGHKSVGKVR